MGSNSFPLDCLSVPRSTRVLVLNAAETRVVLDSLTKDRASECLVHHIDLSKCRSFSRVVQAFGKALGLSLLPDLGKDAFLDVLADLDSGLHLFIVESWFELPDPAVGAMLKCLSERLAFGENYGDGEAVAILVRPNDEDEPL